MKKAFFQISIAILTGFSITSGQGDGDSSGSTVTVDLTVEISIDPVSDDALFPATDSVIQITLYKDAVTSNGPYISSCQVYDKSDTSLTADFDSLPVAKYSLWITFPMYDIKNHIFAIFDLNSDSTVTVTVKPSANYRIIVCAYPADYSIYFGYLTGSNQREPSEYLCVREPDSYSVAGGSFEFTVLSRKKWKLKLKLADEDEDRFAKINKTFWESAFRVKNPFKTEFEPPFEWITVEHLK